jgi:hypothetical protein
MEVRMKRLVLIAIATAALPAASRAERRIEGSFQQITHDCRKDQTVDVAGRLSQITLVGTCKLVKVTGKQNQVTAAAGLFVLVSGNENQVRAEATDAIRVSGGHNQITYRRAVTRRKQTLVTSSGPNNVIKQEK